MLLYDDEYHALRTCIEQGKGYEKTAGHLWPLMKLPSAYARLKACTSERGDQRLKFPEILEVMRFNSMYDVLYYVCDELMHNRPAQKAPQDEEAKIVAVIENAGAQLETAVRALERVRARHPMAAVR
jgi:hypothetical protein